MPHDDFSLINLRFGGISLPFCLYGESVTLDVNNAIRYAICVIRSFRDRETEKLFRRERNRAVPAGLQRVALRKLVQLDAAESLADLNAELGFELDEAGLTQQQAKYAAGGHTWTALIDGRHEHPRKAHSALREWLYARKKEDDTLRAPQLVKEIQD